MGRTTTASSTEADNAVAFFARYLTHVDGEWAGLPFVLAPWEEEIVRKLFGTLNRAGRRQFLKALIGVPRKNGKTTLAAGIGLKLLVADKEPAAQVYCVAADREQARISFDIATRMVQANRHLSALCKPYRHSIVVPKTGSTLKVISAEAYSKHGLNPHGVVFDELHAQPNRELWDVMTTGQGARRQPLVVAITTAGYDRTSICYEQYDYGLRLQKKLIKDPTFFFRWWGAADDDDWTSEEVWAKVNPNYPVTPKPEFLRSEVKQAKAIPARQNTFRRLYTNQWTQSHTRWLSLLLWDENAGLVVAEKLKGRDCFGGLDIASTSDFTAWVLVFPFDDHVEVLARFFLPRAAVEKRAAMRPTLEVWEREGWLTVTEGDVVDDKAIIAQAARDAAEFRIVRAAYDPFDARSIAQTLQDDHGIEMVKVPQSMARLSGPAKELERLLGMLALHHGGNPILRWMADNVVTREDESGRIKPDKKKSTEKIDGIVALVMGIGETMATVEDDDGFAGEFLSALAKTCTCGHMNVRSASSCERCGAALAMTAVG
jgi:phage terminase large subunit-like protein